jgi:glycosyltransferase involved in cell wall biosynthesis
MIHALHLTSEAGVEWNFINYGQKTNLTEELHTLVTDLGISRRVNFAGLKPQAEVREYLETSDVFLHTPVIVVFDLSLLEAMMHAIPVVTTPLEGNREALGVDYPLYAGTAEEVAERLRWIAGYSRMRPWLDNMPLWSAPYWAEKAPCFPNFVRCPPS